MGCCVERQKSTVEEKLVILERALGFTSLKSSNLPKLIKKYSKGHKISKSQFDLMCSDLKIYPKTITHDFVRLFYNKKNEDFDSQLLTTIGIFFSSGEDLEKSRLLFQNYDIESQGLLTIKQVRQMISDLVLISFEKICEICEYAGREIGEIEKLRLAEYRALLMRAKGLMVSVYTKTLLGNDLKIEMEKFVEKLGENNNSVLLDSHRSRIAGRQMVKYYLELAERTDGIQIDVKLAKELSSKVLIYSERRMRRNLNYIKIRS